MRIKVNGQGVYQIKGSGLISAAMVILRATQKVLRIGEMLAVRLERLGVDEPLIHAEVEAMSVARVGRTRDRSVTGQLVDFAKALPYYVPIGAATDEFRLRLAEDKLAHTPCLCGRTKAATIWPDRDSKRLLVELYES